MSLDEWVAGVGGPVRSMPVWNVRSYQIGSYLVSLCLRDADLLGRDPRLRDVVPQLVRSVGSIPATIGEGFARRSRKDRIRYYEYALGSASEAQSWYMAAVETLPGALLEERLTMLARVSQLLTRMIQNERKGLTWGSNARRPPGPPESAR